MSFLIRSYAAAAFALTVSCVTAQPTLQPASIFTDHMVLQRGTPLRVWGQGKPGATVKAELNGTAVDGKADEEGNWTLKLPEQKAGGPFELTLSSDEETTSFKDVLIGEVWVCSGQSNMDMKLSSTENAEEAIRTSSNEKIRLFQVPRNKAVKPLSDFNLSTVWEICSPESVADFSAAGYYFGQELQRELDVPIGLIQSAWGGTKVEWWTPLEGLKKLPFMAAEAKEMENAKTDEALTADYRKAAYGWKKKIMARDPGNKGGKAAWAQAGFDDATWATIALPSMLEDSNMNNFDGSIWYRKEVELTEDQAKKTSILSFCADDQDFTYVNGTAIGATDSPNKLRQYKLPTDLLKPGKNIIALQVWDWGKIGGICGDKDSLSLTFTDGISSTSLSLANDWKTTTGVSFADVPGRPEAPQAIRPTVLYNAMIAPMVKYAIKGAIWYQGEGNARSDTAPVYDEMMASMITEWRKQWGLGDFPFFQVQLASYMKIEPQPGESDWAVLRESQENVLDLVKNTAFASAVDVGDEKDIHPKDKRTVGQRLALNALAIAYGKKVEYMGPIYKDHKLQGNTITVSFSHAKELKTPNGEPLKGFAIAGSDGKFVWAETKIANNTVAVSHPDVKDPKAVRYGWANFVTGNLYNEADLPASPFRTDKPIGK